MTPSTDIERLFKLSLAIGDSMELQPMLCRFLVEMLAVLDGSGGAILQLHQPVADGIGIAPAVCMIPEALPRHPCYHGLWERWSPTTLDQALAERPDALPIVTVDGNCAVHAFRLPGFGILIFLRDAARGALASDLQHAFAPLTEKLANAARACMLEARLIQQTQRLRLATDSAGIGIWEWDPISGQLDWDERTLALFGIGAEDFNGSLDDWIGRIHPDDQTNTRGLIADRLREDARLELHYRIVGDTGEERHLRTQAVILRNPTGDPVRMIGVSLDVTAAKCAEDALRRSRDLAESAHLAQNRFIANMSDEIRTPLNGISSLTELVLNTALDRTQRASIEIIRASADRLLDSLNDILDLARIDAAQMPIEQIPFSLPVMIAESIRPIASQANAKDLELIFDQPGELPQQSLGDPGRIRQILNNLCSNALEFTEHGEVRVQITASPTDDPTLDLILISVSDTGIGIRTDKFKEIFTAFDQGDAVITRQFGGRGLGLTISARLAELMGGRIWVASQEGEGSSFFACLLLARAETPNAPLLPLQQWPGKRVLIVEDHPVNRRTLAYWFKQWGFSVWEARSGPQALELARRCREQDTPLDVYLLDSALHEMDGFHLAERLVDEGLVEHGRMIMVSATGKRGDAARCRALGIHAFLTKPVTPLELREILTHILANHPLGMREPLLTRHHLVEHRQHLRVLLVDDNALSQKLVGSLLREWGHEVSVASTGQTAVDLYRSASFHLIFMDLYMPGMDGIATTRAIRALEQGAGRIPIIAMTVDALQSDSERCLEAGMDHHVIKPLQPQTLEDILTRFADRLPGIS